MSQSDFGTVTRLHAGYLKIGDTEFNVVDEAGGYWVAEKVDEWENLNFLGGTPQKAWADGGYYTRQWVGPGSFSVQISLYSPSGGVDVEKRLECVLESLPQRDPGLVVISYHGGFYGLWSRTEDELKIRRVNPNLIEVKAFFSVADPRRFSANSDGTLGWETVSTGLPYSAGGFTLPFTLPLVITGRAQSGLLDFTVPGVHDARARLLVSGPVHNPALADSVAGWRCRLNLTLREGEVVEILPDERRVSVDGASRRAAMIGEWPRLTPGHHLISFTHEGTPNPTARLDIEYIPAW